MDNSGAPAGSMEDSGGRQIHVQKEVIDDRWEEGKSDEDFEMVDDDVSTGIKQGKSEDHSNKMIA